MSKIAFVHDSKFVQQDGLIYGDPQFGYSLWKKYLSVFEEIIVVCRDNGASSMRDTLVLSSGKNVSFVLAPSLSNVSGFLMPSRFSDDVFKRAFRYVNGVVVRLPSVLGLAAINYCLKNSIPFAVEIVGCAFDAYWNHGSVLSKFYAPFAYVRTKRATKKANHVLYVTERYLQRRYPVSRSISVACSDVMISPQNSRMRNYSSDKPVFVFGMIGSLATRYKGIQHILVAIREIRADLPLFRFRVLGGGSADKWIAMAQDLGVDDIVDFDGILPSGAPVRAWLDSLDCYLQPSLTEGLPRSLIEAMSSGLPAIGSNVGGIPELLSPDSLISPGNVSQLASRMSRAVLDPIWREMNGKKNVARASDFAPELLELRWVNFYRSFSELRKTVAK